jgi:hypothetical protein
MKRKTAKEQELADDARLLRAWRQWHREQLAEVLAGPHAQVVHFLKTMTPASANALLALMRSRTWSDVDANTKFELLHEINCAITDMRAQHNMPPIDDPLPHERLSVFLTIKQLLFPRKAESPPERSGKTHTDRT